MDAVANAAAREDEYGPIWCEEPVLNSERSRPMAVTVAIWLNGREATAVVCAAHQGLQISRTFLRGMRHFTEFSTITLPMSLNFLENNRDVKAVRDALFSVPRNFGCGSHDVRNNISYLRSLGLNFGVNAYYKCFVGVRESSAQCEPGFNMMIAFT